MNIQLPPIGARVAGTTGSGRTVEGVVRSHAPIPGRPGYLAVVQPGGARIFVKTASLIEVPQ